MGDSLSKDRSAPDASEASGTGDEDLERITQEAFFVSILR